MTPQPQLLEQINSKLDLLLLSSTPDEWLTCSDACRVFKFGKSQFWELVAENAFPVARPKPRTTLVKRSDIEFYLRKHYTTVA